MNHQCINDPSIYTKPVKYDLHAQYKIYHLVREAQFGGMLNYSFSNLIGATYRGGSLIFTSDGNSILSPVDNRINVFDLVNNRSFTLPCEARKNIRTLVLSPDDKILLTIDTDGNALLINYVKAVILHRLNFKGRVFDAKFSPCGRFLAVTNKNKVDVWEAPSMETGWQLAKIRSFSGHVDRVLTVDWSANSRYLVTASADMTVRVHCRTINDAYVPVTFISHRSPVRGAYFTSDMQQIVTVSEEGVILTFDWVSGKPADHRDVAGKTVGVTAEMKKQRQKMEAAREKEGTDTAVVRRATQGALDRIYAQDSASSPLADFDFLDGYWSEGVKAFCNQAQEGTKWAKVSKVHLNKEKNLLVVGFSKGSFSIYELPTYSCLHAVSVGAGGELDALSLTPDGEWVAAGCSTSSTLVVWEWQSESYILKQQGHDHGITCVAYSPAGTATNAGSDLDVRTAGAETGGQALGGGTGQVLATGGSDGKVKLWSTQTGFCFATFSEHAGPILDLCFTPQGNAVISSSTDGTIRAFDLLRYRNFRTFASPSGGEQFASIAVDGGGEILLGATQGEAPRIYVWSIQTGKLLETLAGHTATISQLAFNPHPSAPGVFASASWDNTVRVWDIFGRMNKGGAPESFEHTSMVAAVAWDPRANRQFAAATMGGSISIWDAEQSDQLGEIQGLRDIRSGRKAADRMPANNSRGQEKGSHVGKGVDTNQFFSSIIYAPSGQFLLAGSRNSPRVCIYDVDARTLVRTVQLTHNFALDGILVERNSKLLDDAGFTEQDYALTDSEDEVEHTQARAQQRIKEAKALPGTKAGELANPKLKEVLSIHDVSFSPDGREWAAASSHGCFVYSVDLLGAGRSSAQGAHMSMSAQPIMLTQRVTVQAVRAAVEAKQWGKALVTALALNDHACLLSVFENMPVAQAPLVIRGVSAQLLVPLLHFIQRELLQPQRQAHFEAGLRWLSAVLETHLASLSVQAAPTKQAQAEKRKQDAEQRLQQGLGQAQQSDIRTALLLTLRQLQAAQNSVGRLLGDNARRAAFLLRAAQASGLQLDSFSRQAGDKELDVDGKRAKLSA